MDFKELQQFVGQAQQRVQEMQGKLAQITVEASAGGGMVSVKMNGHKQILSLNIAPDAINPNDREMLQDLIVAAINECSRKVEAAAKESMGGLLGGLNIPGLT